MEETSPFLQAASPILGSQLQGGSVLPGLILPAAILVAVLLSTAVVIYLTGVRASGGGKGGPGAAK